MCNAVINEACHNWQAGAERERDKLLHCPSFLIMVVLLLHVAADLSSWHPPLLSTPLSEKKQELENNYQWFFGMEYDHALIPRKMPTHKNGQAEGLVFFLIFCLLLRKCFQHPLCLVLHTDKNMCVPSNLMLHCCSLANGEQWLGLWILTVSITAQSWN